MSRNAPFRPHGQPNQGLSHHNRKPKSFAAPDKGPQASSVRTRNFGMLVSSAGDEEALGIALGLPLSRIKELRDGYGFSNETAFHIETELRLPSGWLDRNNAVVPADLGLPKADVESEAPTALPEQADSSEKPTATAKSAKVLRVFSHREPATALEVPAQSARTEPESAPAAELGGSPVDAAPAPIAQPVLVQVAPQSSGAAAAPLSFTIVNLKEKTMPRGPRIQEPETLMETRRANLLVLTDFPGGKTGIGRLTGKSPANISHVLHGKKKFTRDVADEFEQALALPEGWMDQPRQSSDVPEEAKKLILDAFSTKEAVTGSRAAAKSTAVRAPRVATPRSQASPSVAASGDALPAARRAVAEMLSESSPVAVAERPATLQVARQVVAQPAVPAQLATEMGQLGELQARPLAQALVRVIILLSRSNELSEEKCLKLLNEVTMMAAPR